MSQLLAFTFTVTRDRCDLFAEEHTIILMQVVLVFACLLSSPSHCINSILVVDHWWSQLHAPQSASPLSPKIKYLRVLSSTTVLSFC